MILKVVVLEICHRRDPFLLEIERSARQKVPWQSSGGRTPDGTYLLTSLFG
ncbi:hypothetical protein AB395_00005309 (plasmid) [Sinorhizobium fredii CCBAU 45436]|nr:hypothetical protein AB395_00005309 [Sinorhizobium fredii CCBAU 45436]